MLFGSECRGFALELAVPNSTSPGHMYTAVPLGDFAAPALPSLSPLVFQTAFVHSSKNLQSVPRSKFSYTEDFADNERLEWVGDALLCVMQAGAPLKLADGPVADIPLLHVTSIARIPDCASAI